MKVYVLWHVYEQSDDFGEHDEEKLIGIYSTEEKARDAIQSHKDLEGFKDLPLECFEIHEYELDRSSWDDEMVKQIEVYGGKNENRSYSGKFTSD